MTDPTVLGLAGLTAEIHTTSQLISIALFGSDVSPAAVGNPCYRTVALQNQKSLGKTGALAS